MTRQRAVLSFVTVGIAALIGIGACSDDPAGGSNDNQSLSDPAVLETEYRAIFLPIMLGIVDGADRLLTAINGGGSDGVSIADDGSGGFDAVVMADFDANGSRESTISGNYSGTGVATVSNVANPAYPSLDVSLSTQITPTGPSSVQASAISGSIDVDEAGSMNASTTTFTGGAVSVDLDTGNATGTIDCVISGEGESLNIVVTFEDDGAGGTRVRFTGSGVDFTIP